MKPKLFVLALCLILNIRLSIAQAYTQFPDSNAVWDILVADPSSQDSIWYTAHYGLFGDTIINSLNYQKLYFNDGLTDSTITLSSPNTIYNGAIREDITAKKVFYVPKDSVHEGLIYQFNLGYHDTVSIPTIYGYEIEFVCLNYNPDSIQLLNNQYRRRYLLQAEANQVVWIEGIGCGGGLLYNYYWPIWDTLKYTLRCFHQNDTLLFHMNGCPWPIQPCQSIFDNCYTRSLITNIDHNKDIMENGINIFPNPITGESILKIPGMISGKNVLIEIYNAQGKLIKKINNVDKNEIQLNASEFYPGLYIFKLVNNKNIYTSKFIVQ